MKTPIQELLEWVRATLPMDLDTPILIEQKIESMLEKEKEVMEHCWESADFDIDEDGDHFYEWQSFEEYYSATFNPKSHD